MARHLSAPPRLTTPSSHDPAAERPDVEAGREVESEADESEVHRDQRSERELLDGLLCLLQLGILGLCNDPGHESAEQWRHTEHEADTADYLAYDPRLAEPREHVAEAMRSGEEDGEGQKNMPSICGRIGHGRQPCDLTDGESRGFGREQGAGSRAGRRVAATPSDPRVAAAPLFSRRAGLVAARLDPCRQGTPDALAARP